MVLRVPFNLDPSKKFKRQQMGFVSDLEELLTPRSYIVFPNPGG
jgi:hypothetical protein